MLARWYGRENEKQAIVGYVLGERAEARFPECVLSKDAWMVGGDIRGGYDRL